MVWKGSNRCLTLLHNIISIIIRNLFCQVLNVQRKFFVNACIFDIMQFDNMLQKFFNCSYCGTRHYQQELSNLPPLGIYLLKVNNRNTRIRCEICSRVNNIRTRKTSNDVLLVSLLLMLSRLHILF